MNFSNECLWLGPTTDDWLKSVQALLVGDEL